MKSEKMTLHGVEDFEALFGQIQVLYDEILTLSKKSPNDCFNVFKINLVNGIVKEANAYFEKHKKNLPIAGFNLFDLDKLPSNSDVVLVLSQYLQSLEKIRFDNIVQHIGLWYWVIDGSRSTRKAAPPKFLK